MKNTTALILAPIFWPNLPPLSIYTLQSYVQLNGYSLDVYDYNNISYRSVSADLKKQWKISCNQWLEDNIFSILQNDYSDVFTTMIDALLAYDQVGFSCFRSNFTVSLAIAKILKQKNPKIKIVFGGPEIASQYFRYQEKIVIEYGDCVDYFVVGEGEVPLLKFLKGEYPHSKIYQYEELEDLSTLPMPDYSHVDFSHYPRKHTLSVMSSRGCVRRCQFCAERLLYKGYKQYSVESLIRHMKELKKRGCTSVVFHDSLINGDVNRLEEFCDAMIQEFNGIPWEAQIAVRTGMSDELFQKMKQSGCYHLFIGLESGSDIILKKMNKGFTTDDALWFFSKLNLNNLSFGVSLIVGYPGETEKEYNESLRFLIENKESIPRIEQVNPFVYYDGIAVAKEYDYRNRKELLGKTEKFIEEIKNAGFKYTKAFMCNLVEKLKN